jgi:hypothetical protein
VLASIRVAMRASLHIREAECASAHQLAWSRSLTFLQSRLYLAEQSNILAESSTVNVNSHNSKAV